MDKLQAILRVLLKPLHDIALTLYDDLEFRAMSLPRIACFALTTTVIAVTVYWCRTGLMFPSYTELCTLTGAVWGCYTAKRWRNPPEGGHEHNGHQQPEKLDKGQTEPGG